MLFDEALDVAGEPCDALLPRLRGRLGTMAPGTVLRLFCDDPAARSDVSHLCEADGHEFIGRLPRPDGCLYFIRKG